MKSYIYLDWNIFKYLKSKDEKYDSLRETVENVMRGYVLPYSEAHIYDLLSNFDASKYEYVKSDLEIVTKYSKNVVVGEGTNSGEFVMEIYEPIEIFNKVRKLSEESKPHVDIAKIAGNDPNGTVKIDMDKMNKDSPLYAMLENTTGWYIPEIAAAYFANQFQSIFDEKDPYRSIRNAVKQVREGIKNNKTLEMTKEIEDYISKAEKFLELIEVDDMEVLKSNFIEAFSSHLSLTGKTIDDLSVRNKIVNAYALIDFHPLFQEKIKNNRASNMTRDSVHAYYAMKSKYFISFDKATIEKTNFVYEVFGIKTKALHMDDFVKKFR